MSNAQIPFQSVMGAAGAHKILMMSDPNLGRLPAFQHRGRGVRFKVKSVSLNYKLFVIQTRDPIGQVLAIVSKIVVE